MPHATRTLSPTAVHVIAAEGFAPSGPDRYGLEVEWPVHRAGDVATRPSPADMARLAATDLPGGGRVTFEPGGQVELSTAPERSVGAALAVLERDTTVLHAALAGSGYAVETLAVDARRPPHRVLETPRYAALEAFLAAGGPSGAWMMSNTASTQVNVSHDEHDPVRRWYTLHRIAPVLVATLANSVGVDERGRRWTCLRQAIWNATDAGRTRPVRLDRSPTTAWLEYALDADVAFVCSNGSGGAGGVGLLPGLPFGRWLRDGHDLGWPTAEDFRYHLSMLFPPVRPRGWLELRVLDAMPDLARSAAALVVAAACTAPAAREIESAIPDPGPLWTVASRRGLGDPVLARAAERLFRIARRHLDAVTEVPAHAEALAEVGERYVERRRTPGEESGEVVDLRRPGFSPSPRPDPRSVRGRP